METKETRALALLFQVASRMGTTGIGLKGGVIERLQPYYSSRRTFAAREWAPTY